MAFQHRWYLGESGFPVWGTLVMVCLAASPMASDQQQSSRIVVVSVSGDWTRGDCKGSAHSLPLRFGETLTAEATCLFGKEGGSIVLKPWWPTDDQLYPFQCQKADLRKKDTSTDPRVEVCAVDLTTLRKEKGSKAPFIATIWGAFERMKQPDKYMVAASRGAESELVDAVVPIENGQIDVQASFREMDPGPYYVELGAVGTPSLSGPPSRVTFAKGQAARVEAQRVRSGLYKLALVTEKGDPGDSDCWILVAPPPEYARQAAAYARAESESKKLPEQMDARATRALLRAYLESLANPQQATAVRP